MNSDLKICPAPAFVIAVLANTDFPSASRIADFIANRLPNDEVALEAWTGLRVQKRRVRTIRLQGASVIVNCARNLATPSGNAGSDCDWRHRIRSD
jgi:hypothetical protein